MANLLALLPSLRPVPTTSTGRTGFACPRHISPRRRSEQVQRVAVSAAIWVTAVVLLVALAVAAVNGDGGARAHQHAH